MDTLYIESFITIPNYYFSCLLSVPYGMVLAVTIVALMIPLKKGNVGYFGRNLFAFGAVILAAIFLFPSVSFQSIPSDLASMLVSGTPHEIEIRANIFIFSVSAGITLLLFLLHTLTVNTVITLNEQKIEAEGIVGTIVYLNNEFVDGKISSPRRAA
jgi:hypothetical protein